MLEIITTVLAMTGIAGTLAIIISVADLLLNNYGTCKIDINNGKRTLEVKGGSSLLSTLAGEKIFIPSACGGKATCGLCKLSIAEGAGPLLPTEEPFLSREEREQKMRLSCQVKVKGDMKILIPEDLFNIREYQTTVEKIEDLTRDIKLVRMKLDKPETISFKAGQYVQFYTKPYGKVRETVFRAYSMASAPSDNKAVELIIRQVPQGICTTYVHTALQEGDNVRLSGPYGDFYLRGNADNLVMIAGGSGLAPIRSLVLDILETGLDKNMTFYFGAVTKKDLYYVDFFTKLAEEHKNFSYVPVLSGPLAEDNWTGEVGLVTAPVDRDVPSGDNYEAYLCGSPGMIGACVNLLKSKGFTDETIFYDKF